MWNDTPSLGVTMYVDEESSILMGDVEFKFHFAPGHTGDSMIIECGNYIFTGDFLFTGKGGVGRDDLPSGRVHIHWQALDVLDRFESQVLVCTGHDPPGTEMMSLDWNRQNNPVLGMESYEEYAEWQSTTSASLGSVSKIKLLYLQIYSQKYQTMCHGLTKEDFLAFELFFHVLKANCLNQKK